MKHNYKTCNDYERLWKLVLDQRVKVVAFTSDKSFVEIEPGDSLAIIRKDGKRVDCFDSLLSLMRFCDSVALEFIDPEPEREGWRDKIKDIESKGFYFELISKGLGWCEISILNKHMEKIKSINVAPHEKLEKLMDLLLAGIVKEGGHE